MLLSIIIPVFNERPTLGTVICVMARTLPDGNKEIIVVDGCSKDGTRARASTSQPRQVAHPLKCRIDAIMVAQAHLPTTGLFSPGWDFSETNAADYEQLATRLAANRRIDDSRCRVYVERETRTLGTRRTSRREPILGSPHGKPPIAPSFTDVGACGATRTNDSRSAHRSAHREQQSLLCLRITLLRQRVACRAMAADAPSRSENELSWILAWH